MELILASGSPRRRELLSLYTTDFTVCVSDFDESTVTADTPAHLVEQLARGKCLAVAKDHPDAVVIGCDTVVDMNGEVFGKPHGVEDAKRMLLEYNKETKRLDDLYRCAAKQCGISECAFWILYTLRAEERQFTQAEICEFLIEPKQTVHSALKKLEAEGYLARTSSADLRSKHVALTEKGEQFARTWIDRVPEAETAALGAMPEEECAAFVRGLHLFCRLLEEGFRENGAI